ncbi:MAG TPA: sulfite exporter TauE/SafE family protein [Desulfohalobiaceae bacterium]|nr:sulfite exporter TauE/SafE family protein [Desulfohalobiaceae bacterium]
MLSVFKRAPELMVLILLAVLGYAAMGIFSQVTGTEVLSATSIWSIVVSSFLLSTAIAIVAVIAGIGGGVLFTPVVMAFTSIDTLIVRATGLVVAMFSGLISSGPFMKKGLADIKVVFYCSVPIVIGAISGSFGAIFLSSHMGAMGDAVVRLALGLILIFIALMFILGGSKTEYPKAKKIDNFTHKLGLKGSYWEESLNDKVEYNLTRALPGAFLFLLVGFTGGFFGLGGGWAVVPVLNLVMATPLKVSAACSGVLLALGNSCAIWPYIMYGALIPVFVAPWMIGQVVGGILGAHILARIRAGVVRNILIVILILTSIKLIARGLETMFGINIPIF